MTCLCALIQREPHQCPEHYSLYRNGRRLTSVSRIVGMWPQESCSSCHWPMFSEHVLGCRVKANIDNARERGIGVDELFSGWLNGTLQAIPSDTRQDVKERTLALIEWWQKTHPPESQARAQVVLASETVGGIVDILDGYSNYILDLKNTSEIAAYYPIQLGGYAVCYEVQFGMLPRGLGVIHCTQKKDGPVSIRVVEFDVAECKRDFLTCWDMYELVKRRKPKRNREVEEL